jgi:putative radical SAM enzyme (TIGR03279 family)
MKIKDIKSASPLFGIVRKGDELVAVNGRPIKDIIDFRYQASDGKIVMDFMNDKGKRFKARLRLSPGDDIGLTFEEDEIRRCGNKCIFCFVRQQPKGMRRTLYIRDDDYRLSFAHGNFISLSNLSKEDERRIIRQRLSPLYVSAHTTDDELRRNIFRNDRLPPLLPYLERFIKKGIKFHTQVVVCPGINDGKHLEKTLRDLFNLYPGALTVGVVPVGLTRFRKGLPKIKPFDKKMAEELLSFINERQAEFRKKSGSRFVFAADEFYILARKELPKLSEYEEMAQFENGIGMMRLFLANFNRRKRKLNGIGGGKRIAALTGESAYGQINKGIMPYLRNATDLKIDLYQVENRFWGRMVTVSGLLTGRDIWSKIREFKRVYDAVILPPNCINEDRLFLDNVALDDLKRRAKMEIMVGTYDMVETLMRASK